MIRSIDVAGSNLTIAWEKSAPENGGSAVFPAIWLRDNCRCPECRHAGNGQRLYEITDLPEDLAIGAAVLSDDKAVRITWQPGGHVSTFTPAWLADHDLSAEARRGRKRPVKLWSKAIGTEMPIGDWRQMVSDPAAELAFLDTFHAHGFGLIRNSPTVPGTVLQIGNHLGFVRVTNYGALFDVKSVANPTNLAYTPVGLGVHSDNPYRDPTPGVQLLHCLESTAPGGDTLLVDGFNAAEILRREAPDAFDLLTRVPVNFRFRSNDADLMARQTLISVDEGGNVVGVHFNNRSLDWLDAPAAMVVPWFAAYRKFAEVLHRPEGELIFRLEPGDCVVMQNDRALHGRTAFDPSKGSRHLQGAYVDKDGLESRARVLRRQIAEDKGVAA
ncbi:gamma-butyrobetaine dioxygenase [Dongia mobilis]|uniref:Gamma-butyrobetaine dioxygenase n=1 Tax=Dongia mobilis TaxID=578943 RepID=A0A4V6PXF0_9PROT|nr:TauD/TfdA family dioxygenase [Dongia mobilis]TDQ77702.1 gamma-butyrobetaine dioxygenase [Dongia mobilis]